MEDSSFFATVKKSISDVGAYTEFLTRSFSQSLKYQYLVIAFTLLLFSVLSGFTMIPRIPELNKGLLQAKEFIKVAYPSELVVNIKNGQVSTNVKEPYFIDITEAKDSFQHFITIDTKATFEDFANYKTGVLITKNSIITQDKDNAIKVYPVDKKYNVKIDKAGYDKLATTVFSYFKYLMPAILVFVALFLIIGPFIGAIFVLIGKLFYLLLTSLLFLIIAKVMKKDLGYKQIYRLSLYALTAPFILSSFINFLPRYSPAMTSFSSNLFHLVFLIYMVIIIDKHKNVPSAQ